MIRRILLPLTALLGALSAGAQDSKLHPVTITGRVIDTGCYMVHDGSGPEHEKCARVCAKKGIPLAIVDGDGKVWLPLGADHKNPNLPLMPFIEKKVKVTGTAVDRGGLTGIAIKTIEAAN
jgi:hypothetical protein